MTRLAVVQPDGATTPFLTSAGVSLVVHAVLIAAAVWSTSQAKGNDLQPVPENSIARWLAPPNRFGGQREQREMVRYVALAVRDVVGPGGGLGGVGGTDVVQSSRMAGLDVRDAAPMPSLPGTDSVYSIVDVDSAATRYEWSAAPAFPPSMLDQKQGGYVKAQWVVDESGYADTTTFTVLLSTHAEFTKAVRDALPFMRFRPAKIGRMTVRQLVEQEFTFRVTSVADSAPRKPES